MAILSYAQKQRIARRNSDITRLQSEFQRSSQEYNRAVDDKTATFNSQMSEYNNLYSGYSERLNAYKTRLDDYNARNRAFLDAPWESYSNFNVIARLGPGVYSSTEQAKYGNQQYGPKVASGPYIGEWVKDPGAEKYGIPTYAFKLKEGYSFTGPTGWGTIVGKSVKDPGQFTETFNETAPTTPTMDISAESAKLQADKAYTEREVDERVKARARAVQRQNARPMLSSGTNING